MVWSPWIGGGAGLGEPWPPLCQYDTASSGLARVLHHSTRGLKHGYQHPTHRLELLHNTHHRGCPNNYEASVYSGRMKSIPDSSKARRLGTIEGLVRVGKRIAHIMAPPKLFLNAGFVSVCLLIPFALRGFKEIKTLYCSNFGWTSCNH